MTGGRGAECVVSRTTQTVCARCGAVPDEAHSPLMLPGKFCARHCPVCGPVIVQGGKFAGASIVTMSGADLHELLRELRTANYRSPFCSVVEREISRRRRGARRRPPYRRIAS